MPDAPASTEAAKTGLSGDSHKEDNPQATSEKDETGKPKEGETSPAETGTPYTKDEDGNLVWIVDPADPHSTIYRGKDEAELLGNVAAGVKEKDSYIRELRTQGITSAQRDVADELKRSSKEALGKEVESDEMPDYSDIANKVLARNKGVTAEMLNFTEEQWREYETEHGGLAALRAAQRVDNVRAEIESRYADANVAVLNKKILDDETEAALEILTDEGIDPNKDGLDYRKLVRAVLADEKNRLPNGVLKNGRIVREVQRQVSKIVKSRAVSKTRKEVDEEQAQSRVERKNAGSTETGERAGGGGATKTSPKTTEEAVEQILREYKFDS